MTTAITTPNQRSLAKPIFLSGLAAGTFDICFAILIYAVIQEKLTAEKLLQSVASGVFGADAYSGGITMALYGLLFHFIIAFCFAIGYVVVYPHIRFLKRQPVISGLLYGVFAWLLMNLVVLPLVFFKTPATELLPALTSMLILVVAVGLPIALITHKYYKSRRTSV
jgi:uncharacterized membrane protein YagU involved in acid resistance